MSEFEFDSTNPYAPLMSLADQKSISLNRKYEDKKAVQEESPLLAEAEALEAAKARLRGDTGSGSGPAGFMDLAESAIYQAGYYTQNLFTGDDQTNEDIRQKANREAGITDEDEYRLAGRHQEATMESLANGEYLGAIPHAIRAIPGVAAQSAGVIPEIAASVAATATVGGAPAGLASLARRGKKLVGGVEKLKEGVDHAKNAGMLDKAMKGVKGASKAAGQVSLMTANMTQRNAKDFREEHHRDPTRGEVARMFALNLATTIGYPAGVKHLLVPKFMEQTKKEIGTVAKNLVKGSNLANIGGRVMDATKKVLKAGGAEAAQEYFQTWAEEINVNVDTDKESFFDGALQVLGDEDAQLQALVGGYLGGGVGGGIRLTVAAPQLAAGSALDLTKATVKGTAKVATKVTKAAGRVAQKVATDASYKALSQEERDQIAKNFEGRKAQVAQAEAARETIVTEVKKATSLEQVAAIEDNKQLILDFKNDKELTDEDLKDPKNLEKLKHYVVRQQRAKVATLKAEVAASNAAAMAAKVATNVADKSVEAAKKVVAELDVDVDQLVSYVEGAGKATMNAVKEIRSNTGLGMLELAKDKSAQSAKTVLSLAGDLSLDDLNRVTAVVESYNPELAGKLKKEIAKKKKSLGRIGLLTDSTITVKDLPDTVTKAAETGVVDKSNAAFLTTAFNEITGSKMTDVASIDAMEAAVKAYEESDIFKKGGKGILTATDMEIIKRKLARSSARVKKPKRSKVQKAAKKFAEEVEKKGLVDVLSETAAVKKAVDLFETDTAKGIIKKLKEMVPDLPDLETPEQQAAFEKKIDDKIAAIKKKVKETVVGPGRDRKVAPKDSRIAIIIGDIVTHINSADAAGMAPLIEGAENLYNVLVQNGYNTREDWNDLIDQFPDLTNNQQFFTEVDQYFPSEVAANEATDNKTTETMTEEEGLKQYAEEFPECKI